MELNLRKLNLLPSPLTYMEIVKEAVKDGVEFAESKSIAESIKLQS